jgi:RimJ/RimL family protein N-acetyltransferase
LELTGPSARLRHVQSKSADVLSSRRHESAAGAALRKGEFQMFARTPRLLLRPGWQEDARALHAVVSDEAVMRNLARAPWPYTVADAEAFLARELDPLLPSFLIFNRTRGRPLLVGGCGIEQGADGALELDYWIARPYWGLGFATEATRAVMHIARATGLQNVSSSHYVDNPAAAKVMRKIGFRQTGDFCRRHNPARGTEGLVAVYDYAGESDMRSDTSRELYRDASFLAA